LTTKYDIENLTDRQEKRFSFFADPLLPYQAIKDFPTLFCTFVYPQRSGSTLRVNKRAKFPNLKTKLGKLNQVTFSLIFAETFKNYKDERV